MTESLSDYHLFLNIISILFHYLGDQYYRFNGRVDSGYPRPLSTWRIRDSQVGAIVRWINLHTYFFTPSGDYYQFTDRNFRVDGGYLRDVASAWQGWANNLEERPGYNDNENSVSGLVPSIVALVVAVLLEPNSFEFS